MIPLLQEYRTKCPSIDLHARGDVIFPSPVFPSPELYEALEEYDCKYAIRLKLNPILIRNASDADEALYNAT